MVLGDRIDERLAATQISQSELARRIGTRQSTINSLVHGKSRSSSYLHKIARELGTTPAYLTGETDDPTADLPDDPTTADERTWLEHLRALAPKDRQAVMTLTRSLASGAPGTVHAPGLDYRTEG